MKWLALALRILVGLPMVVFGVVYFAGKLTPPPGVPELAVQLMGILESSGWMKIVKAIEVVGGLLLLTNRFVPFALLILTPVTVNIAIWDALIMKYSMPPVGTILLVFEIVLIYLYLPNYRALFYSKVYLSETRV